MNFADKLIAAVEDKKSVVCVGLDPRWERLPCDLKNDFADDAKGRAKAFLEFNKGIIDAVADFVPVVKPQLAFYEALGHFGFEALEDTCRYARDKGLLVIADAKRNDIGSTADAYAEAFLGEGLLKADALTVNAYLGADGVIPFIQKCRGGENSDGKGIFVLVKTSNPSSGDLQDRVTEDENMSIAELMGHFVESWGSDCIGQRGYSSVGAVVGATYPSELEKLRKTMPNSLFLIPGYGSQGGAADDVKPAFDNEGLGAIVNNSRGIIFAYEDSDLDYKAAAREAVIDMNQELSLF